ncbi:pericentrin-like [Gouania willdenowi]|uniref:pericentrin-like n=1 Tax=Gouania willdenowi TaxID=441366 RepID=UPI00105428E8|nr:pericentrin-like [Gouania willdenowi]
MEMLKEQNREVGHSLELERELTKNQGVELEELKNTLRLMKERQREREEEWERQKRKERQEQKEREKRQERTKNKLRELEFLRQQDQQRMQELQRTLAELERDERAMAAQRLGGWTTGQQNKASSTHHSVLQSDSTPANVSQQQQQQKLSSSQSNLLENLVKDDSELSENVTSLIQERDNLKLRLAQLERRLRHTESELAKVTTATESRPINDVTSNGKLQRLYERYLRAESFRKALVYQKRYLLLVLGGFHEGEQATLRFAYLGALPASLPSSQRRPIGRFRAVVQAVVAVSRMKFLTRKWQKAIRRLSSGVVNGHAPGPLHVHGPQPEVLRQQLSFDDQSLESRHTVSALVPPSKSPFRLHNRSSSRTTLPSVRLGGTCQDPEQSLTQYIQHIEKVQQRLAGSRQGSSDLHPDPK